ncbi:uncharacterized protein si:ch211-149k23.9 isoform X2 [Nerophis ophidion]|uniref:uncharacterized protein si:ch211-149k23.9 isoform X2 n=1 Tax=Nerophis ophidion TaxID=159077 RepID=UPI002ADF661C|nr:uncharacterized protein si:ch211-149k23.9 isoform X2 [Nerophis ophidion]
MQEFYRVNSRRDAGCAVAVGHLRVHLHRPAGHGLPAHVSASSVCTQRDELPQNQCLRCHVHRALWSPGHGGPHDVHHRVPDDRHRWPQRLETSVLGLRLVLCTGVAVLQLLYGRRRGHAQLLHQDHHRAAPQAEAAPGGGQGRHARPLLRRGRLGAGRRILLRQRPAALSRRRGGRGVGARPRHCGQGQRRRAHAGFSRRLRARRMRGLRERDGPDGQDGLSLLTKDYVKSSNPQFGPVKSGGRWRRRRRRSEEGSRSEVERENYFLSLGPAPNNTSKQQISCDIHLKLGGKAETGSGGENGRHNGGGAAMFRRKGGAPR